MHFFNGFLKVGFFSAKVAKEILGSGRHLVFLDLAVYEFDVVSGSLHHWFLVDRNQVGHCSCGAAFGVLHDQCQCEVYGGLFFLWGGMGKVYAKQVLEGEKIFLQVALSVFCGPHETFPNDPNDVPFMRVVQEER